MLAAFADLIKTLAWPVVVVWGILYWRDELKAATKRLTEIGFAGAKFASPEQQVPAPPIAALPVSKEGKETTRGVAATSNVAAFVARVKGLVSDDQLQPSIRSIRNELVAIAGDDLSDQVEALIYNSASLNVQLMHERSYNIIFGSQLTLLAQANGTGGLAPALAKQLYEQARSANSTVYASYTFEAWIGFLINSALLAVDAHGNYVLTNFGRGFLKYIIDRQLTVFKPN
jgi:hypothetical protein